MKCKKCGKDVGKNIKFCENCGAKIKKDKRGLIIVLIIILALIVALLSSNYIYNVLKYSEKDYKMFENQLVTAAKDYKDSKYEDDILVDGSNIVMNDLKSYYTGKYDLINKCEGYVLVRYNEEDSDNTYKAYIKCGRYYHTSGYNFTLARKSYVDKLEITKEEETFSGKELYIFKYKSGDYESVRAKEKNEASENESLIRTYKCKFDYCSPVPTLSNGYYTSLSDYVIIYDDDAYIRYNYKNDKSFKTKLSRENLSEGAADAINGLIVKSGDKYKYYSYDSKKVIIETSDELISNDLYSSKNYVVSQNISKCSSNLYNTKTGEVAKNINGYFSTIKLNNVFIPTINECSAGDSGGTMLLDDSLNPIFDDYYDISANENDVNGNNIYGYKYNDSTNTSYYTYNVNTKKLTKGSAKYPIMQITDEFIIVNKDNMITITDKNNNELKEVDRISDGYYLMTYETRYYKTHDDHPEGLYLVFSKTAGDCYEYHYNKLNGNLTKYDMEFCGGYGKPVLYLYPKTKTNVEVTFEHPENLTTTYPKFNGSWKVEANPNGDLYDSNGKYYYALYWEEQKNHNVTFDTGFYVTKDNAIGFLEEKLSYIGFNKKERNEFIMYWLPIIEKNDKNLIYFELTEERDSYNKLKITPKPDSILRVAIHVKKVDSKVDIKEQKLTKFKRKGFAAVEWGGVQY